MLRVQKITYPTDLNRKTQYGFPTNQMWTFFFVFQYKILYIEIQSSERGLTFLDGVKQPYKQSTGPHVPHCKLRGALLSWWSK